ncbi:MAG: head GIN domain-containing protein [Desulfobacterales bacterium]|jgi:hypothetical protein
MNIRIIRRLLVLSVMAFLAAGCNVLPPSGCSGQAVQGSGEVIAEDRNVSAFNEIKLKGMGNVILSRGESQSVEIVTDDNIIPLIETIVHSKKLIITYKKNNVKPTTLDFLITVADLKGVSISGSGDITGKSRFLSDNFYANISGSGDISMELEVNRMESGITGSGSINLFGKTNHHRASITGSGDIDAFGMDAKNVSVKISGSGDCKVNAAETLTAKISGSGDVYYIGQPQVNTSISGSGSIKSRN